MSPRISVLVVYGLFMLLFSHPLPAAADINASNAHVDREQFEACGNAMDRLDDSVAGTRAAATTACAGATIYYGRKLEAAKSEDAACLNGLYAGSSAARYAHILKSSMNQAGEKKMLAFAQETLHGVVASCPNEPNITRAAKGILSSLSLI